MLTLVILFLLVLALWFLQGQRSAIRRNGERLPRPPGTLPLAGNGFWFLQPRHKLLDWFATIQPVVGFDTYEISVPSLPPAIVVNDPRNVEHVLKNNELFIKGDFFRSRSWDLFAFTESLLTLSSKNGLDLCIVAGNGIINADGLLWKIQRKAGLRFFGNANLKSFINEVLPPFLGDTKEYLDKASEEGTIIDLQHVFLELTTRLMGKMAYDMDMHGSLPFSKAFDYASGAITDRFTNPFWKAKDFLFGAKLRRAVKEVKDFGREIVSATVMKRESEKATVSGSDVNDLDPLQNNLINALLDNIEDQQVVADAAMNFLSAGRDTTAQSLTWTFYNLMRHPTTISLIKSELLSVFPQASSSLPLSFDTIQPSYLPYTMAVFNETIRLYPLVPFELKECTAPTTFPDGTWLPKGAVVLWVPWAMGRSTLIWGEDATTFRPARWLEVSPDDPEGKPSLMSKTAYEFPVFNAGPRTCLGKKMAELLAVHVIASLVWEYEFAEVRDGKGNERVSQNSLTLPMEGGLPCLVKRVERV